MWALGRHRMTAYAAFLALLQSGFRPPQGPGRCPKCFLHTKSQGHRDGCPNNRKGR